MDTEANPAGDRQAMPPVRVERSLPEPDFVDVDGTTVATYVFGPENGSPAGDIVFCHGTPWSSAVWAEIATHLSRRYRVFLWDMPGYGQSMRSLTTDLGLPAQMRRLAALLSYWNPGRPHVVAHDIGGGVALGAHLLHSAEFASLALWDVVTLHPWGSPFFRLVAEHAEVFGRLPAELHSALVREYIAGAANHGLSPGWLDRLSRPWTTGLGQAAFYRQIAALEPAHTEPIVERLHAVRCDVAIGWGREDPWIPVEQAAGLQELLPGHAPVTIVDGAGHLTPVEAGQRVREVLDRWLPGDSSDEHLA